MLRGTLGHLGARQLNETHPQIEPLAGIQQSSSCGTAFSLLRKWWQVMEVALAWTPRTWQLVG